MSFVMLGLVPSIHAFAPSEGRLHPKKKKEGDRGREGVTLPALRTVRAVCPHTALQSVVSSSGRSRRLPGCGNREQPRISEEGIWPALLVDRPVAEVGALVLPEQERAQPSSDEPVER